MTDGQLLIATWKKICEAIDCKDKRTAKKRLKARGVKVIYPNGTPTIKVSDIQKLF